MIPIRTYHILMTVDPVPVQAACSAITISQLLSMRYMRHRRHQAQQPSNNTNQNAPIQHATEHWGPVLSEK